jgi:hypothetical protein
MHGGFSTTFGASLDGAYDRPAYAVCEATTTDKKGIVSQRSVARLAAIKT